MERIIKKYQPDHFYGLAAQSHVGTSFNEPLHTWDATGRAVLVILEAIRSTKPECRFYNAASSEMFGSMYSMEQDYDQYSVVEHFNITKTKPIDLWVGREDDDFNYKRNISTEHCNSQEEALAFWKKRGCHFSEPFQNEDTPMRPMSPYGCAKLAGFHATRLYRESYGMFASSGILFNHEGEHRSITFVTRKITNYVARLRLAKDVGVGIEKLHLGNLNASRDWSYAGDMVRAMYLMLMADKPDDYVVGSGKSYTIKEFADIAFKTVCENWEDHVEIDQSFIRPAEVDYLRADPSKIKETLGWEPEYDLQRLITEMIENDFKRCKIKYQVYGDI